MPHYAVTSPTMESPGCYEPPEPPEQFACYVEVDAPTRRKARHLAVKTPEFREWVEECYGDSRCPFAGLLVEDTAQWGPDMTEEEYAAWLEGDNTT